MKAKLGYNQSLIDFAIQHCGAAEMAWDVAVANDLSITDELVAGMELNIPSVGNQSVVSYMLKNKVKPATGKTVPSDFVPEVPVKLAYDDIDNIAAIYSMRNPRTSWTGDCLRIRRSIDGQELNIGYDVLNGVDQTAISMFCMLGHGQIVKWYDASGNGHDLVQNITTNQPYIYYNGSMITMNGKPTLDLHNTANSVSYMTTTIDVAITTNPYTVFGEFRWSTSANGEHTYLFDNNAADGSRSLIFSNSGGSIYCHQVSSLDTGISRPTTQSHFYYLCKGADSEFGLNGATAVTGNVGANGIQKGITLGYSNLAVGAPTDTFDMEGQVQELVWFSGDKSAERATIETIITNYYE